MLHVAPLGFLSFSTGGYVPAGAIWLDGSADYLSWTPSGAATSEKIGTISFWVKRAKLGEAADTVFQAETDSATQRDGIAFGDGTNPDFFDFRFDDAGATGNLITSGVERDVTAWQHWVVAYDTTQATASDRVKIYKNGVQVTSFGTATYPSLNYVVEGFFQNGHVHRIGVRVSGSTEFFDGYFAEFIGIDGQQLTASDFGEFDTNGNWVPVDPSGLTFGTNGFWLDFADSADLGNDVSGNGNDWTPTSMSPANSTNDRPADDAANEFGNYATGNPLVVLTPSGSLSNANLVFQPTSNSIACGTIAIPGDSAFKFQATWTAVTGTGNARGIGFRGVSNLYTEYRYWNAASAPSFALDYSGQVFVNGVGGSTFTGFTSGNVVTLAYKNGSLWAAINGTWMNSGNPDAGTGAIITGLDTSMLWVPFVLQDYGASQNGKWTFNFQSVTGSNADTFELFNTANLPAPTVTDPSVYFNTVLYTGTGAIKSVTGVGFQPDFVWIKTRSNNLTNHQLYDVIRAAPNYLYPNLASAQQTLYSDVLTSFDSDGFSLGADASTNDCNYSGRTYVAWCLKAGGAGSTNENGSIPSTVSVADHGGFSIVKYTGTGTGTPTVGHGLSSKPGFIMVKKYSAAGTSWYCYHDALGATKVIWLNLTDAAYPDPDYWNNTEPTSTVWQMRANSGMNALGADHMAYCFARTPGLIGIGSYVGNGSPDGPYVVVDDGASGFRPAFLMIKCGSAATTNWNILDAARDTYNPMDKGLRANETIAEFTGQTMDFTANGFKLRLSGSDYNTLGATYIYLAFAEYPFGGDGVAQAKAR
jgi:hypothetical protein